MRILKLAAAILTASVFLAAAEAASDPTRSKRLNELGLKQESAGQPEEAIRLFTQAINADPASAAPYKNRARLRFQTDAVEESLADFDQYLLRQPEDLEAWGMRGDVNAELGNLGKAVEDYSRAIHNG